jgi:Holliday junction resolvase RusA-like endonuclease
MSYEAGVVLAYRNRYADRARWEKGVPLRMRITACLGVPAGTATKRKARMLGELPTKKPDADNIAKIVADALNGIAYYDDAQIVDLQVRKIYAESPHVRIEIQEAGE